MKHFLFIFLFSISLIGFSQNETLFEAGKEHYKNGKFQQAAQAWLQVLENGAHSASLYYNLGNAHYKLNQIGPSIYYYEKALQLAPNNTDIKNNLAFAENAKIDVIEPLPKTLFSKWYNGISGIFTYNGWAVTAVFFAILFAMLFLFYYFSLSEKRKRLFFSGSLICAVLLLGTLAMAFNTYGASQKQDPAIVFATQAQVKSEPNMGSNTAFTLHEGTKVEIIAKDADWARIRLADGKDGWIPFSGLKRL